MVDLNGREIEGGSSEAQELKDLIEHWVQDIDQGMGGTADGVDPAAEPDPAPEAG